MEEVENYTLSNMEVFEGQILSEGMELKIEIIKRTWPRNLSVFVWAVSRKQNLPWKFIIEAYPFTVLGFKFTLFSDSSVLQNENIAKVFLD